VLKPAMGSCRCEMVLQQTWDARGAILITHCVYLYFLSVFALVNRKA